VGQAIVNEARERGVEAIVLGAEEPSRIRGGALLGGSGGPLDNYLGDVTKYVIRKAQCRVILTAAPAEAGAKARGEDDGESTAADTSASVQPEAQQAGSPAGDGASGPGAQPAGRPPPKERHPAPSAAATPKGGDG
jgi:APA family basic amino acid/polyamine antiporter